MGAPDDPSLARNPAAPRNAAAVRDWLLTAAGLREDHVLLLVDGGQPRLAPVDGGQPRLDPARPAERVAPTLANIKLAVARWLARRAAPCDTVVLYYCGPAARTKSLLLLPQDANAAGLDETALPADWLAERLAPYRAICWYDLACAPPQQAAAPRNGTAFTLARPRIDDAFPEALRRGTVLPAARRSGTAKVVLATKPPTATRPELLLQSGHTEPITAYAFAPDGRTLYTGSMDNTARAWDLASGRVTATFKGHGAMVHGIALSPDGRTLLTASGDGTAVLWDTASATKRVTLPHQGRVWAACFSPDGKRVATAGQEGVLRTWDAATGRLASTRRGHADTIASVAWGADSIATAGWDGTVRMWPAVGPGVPRIVQVDAQALAVGFAPDGRALAYGTASGTLALLDPAGAPRVLRHHAHAVTHVAFSPDGATLASGDRDGVVAFWDTAGGTLVRAVHEPHVQIAWLPAWAYSQPMAFSPDGRLLATGWQNARLGEGFPMVWDADLAPDGETLVTASADGGFVQWDLRAGQPRGSLPQQGSPTCATYTRDGRLLISGGYGIDGAILLWDPPSGRLERKLEGHAKEVRTLSASADGRLLASSDFAGTVLLWDLATFKPTRVDTDGSAAALSPDGRLLAVVEADDHVRVREVPGLRPRLDVPLPPGFRLHTSVAFSPDGRLLAATNGSGAVWRTSDGHREATFEGQSASFSRDGRWLCTARKNVATLYDARTLRPVRTLVGHSASITAIRFTPTHAVTAALDGSVRFWDLADGALQATLAPLASGTEWVVMAPDGLFDGTARGQRQMQWRIGDRRYALDQFFNACYQPGLLAAVLRGEHPRARLDRAALQAPPRVRVLSPRGDARTRQGVAAVWVSLEDQGGGISHPWLYLNGHRLPESQVQRTREGFQCRVELVEGANRLRATAFNEDGTVESVGDEVTVTWDAPAAERPTLHVLAVGLDRYASGLSLQCAAKDADAIARFFRPGLFKDVEVHRLFNEQATKQALDDALKELAAAARPHDAVLVYLAGHGALVGDVFYFLPWDARVDDDDAIRDSALSQVELAERLARIPATKQIVILDACHAGAAARVTARDPIGLMRAQQRLARSCGSFMIAASTAQQKAVEIPELGHGVLTYTLLSALGENGSPAAMVDDDGEITVNALLRYVSAEVPRLTRRYYGEAQDVVQASSGQDFPLVRVSLEPVSRRRRRGSG